MPTVLLIEDSKTQALRMQIGLQQQGFKVVIANLPKDAIDIAKEASPDVVLSDVNMPGMNGFQLCEAFKADSALAAIPVLLTSATATDPEDVDKAAQCGAAGFVEKGLDPATLANRLNAAIA